LISIRETSLAAKKRKRKAKAAVRKFNMRARFASGDLVRIQISAHLKRVPKGIKITKALLADMIRRKAADSAGQWDGHGVAGAREGKNPRGIVLKITRWQNPQRKKGKRGQRDYGSQADRWGSLRYALSQPNFVLR
jgi:hypothetical protein